MWPLFWRQLPQSPWKREGRVLRFFSWSGGERGWNLSGWTSILGDEGSGKPWLMWTAQETSHVPTCPLLLLHLTTHMHISTVDFTTESWLGFQVTAWLEACLEIFTHQITGLQALVYPTLWPCCCCFLYRGTLAHCFVINLDTILSLYKAGWPLKTWTWPISSSKSTN